MITELQTHAITTSSKQPFIARIEIEDDRLLSSGSISVSPLQSTATLNPIQSTNNDQSPLTELLGNKYIEMLGFLAVHTGAKIVDE